MKGKQRDCRACGAGARLVRKDYRFLESGLDNVILKDLEVVVCPKCKSEAPRIPQHDDLMRTIAVALIDKPSELTGPEVRFLRKYLGAGSEQFARTLGIDRSHLSRVENGALEVSRQTDRLVRTVALIHDPALIGKMKQLGRDRTIIARLGEIQPEAQPIQVQVGREGSGYTYDLQAAA
jgi:putative zinc finger/helix-turn-helix YgiT family protein